MVSISNEGARLLEALEPLLDKPGLGSRARIVSLLSGCEDRETLHQRLVPYCRRRLAQWPELHDESSVDHEGEILRQLGEPDYRVSLERFEARAVRLTLYRAFRDNLCVRLEVQGEEAFVFAHRFRVTPPHPEQSGWVVELVDSQLLQGNPRELPALLAELDEWKFWEVPTEDPDAGLSRDGEVWRLEAVDAEGHHHLIERHNPEDGPLRWIGTRLLGWAALIS